MTHLIYLVYSRLQIEKIKETIQFNSSFENYSFTVTLNLFKCSNVGRKSQKSHFYYHAVTLNLFEIMEILTVRGEHF